MSYSHKIYTVGVKLDGFMRLSCQTRIMPAVWEAGKAFKPWAASNRGADWRYVYTLHFTMKKIILNHHRRRCDSHFRVETFDMLYRLLIVVFGSMINVDGLMLPYMYEIMGHDLDDQLRGDLKHIWWRAARSKRFDTMLSCSIWVKIICSDSLERGQIIQTSWIRFQTFSPRK